MVENKICSNCKINKNISEFGKQKNSSDGYKSRCKKCRSLLEKNKPETRKKYYECNKERLKIYKKEYIEKNKDFVKEMYKKWYDQNGKEYYKKWREKNSHDLEYKQYLKKQKREWDLKNRSRTRQEKNERYKNDIQFKLQHQLRIRLHSALKHSFKNGSAVRDLGCSIDELKVYLESKFQPGMDWNNWAHDGWHIDHIRPLSSFDLTNREELLKAVHYTNLQPLWAKDNISKGAKYESY